MSQLIPPISITLDRERTLKCDFNAFAYIKHNSGRNIFAQQNPLGEISHSETGKVAGIVVDPDGLRVTLCALLLADDPSMTPLKAGALITGDNFKTVLEKCSVAIGAFFPDKKESESPLATSPASA